MKNKLDSSNTKKHWLTWEVFGFGLTSFFSDLSHEVATTLLPVFLASLGAPPYAIGLIEGVSDGIANIAKLLGGWVCDQLGKRKLLALIGYFLTGLTQGFFAFVVIWPQALLIRAIGWLGRGWRTPIRDALFHQSVPPETSGRAFGFERALDTLGAVIAPAIAFFCASRVGYRNFFLWTWVPGILAVLCFFVFIKDRRISELRSFSLLSGIRLFSSHYKRFLLGVTLFGLSDFSHAILIYWAGVLMTPIYGAAKAGSFAILFYVFHNIIYALASYPLGHLGDKIGKSYVLGLGYLIACAMFIALIFCKGNMVLLVIIFLLGGFYIAIEDTLERAIAGDLLSLQIKGTGYGVLASLNGIGDFVSSAIVGILLSIGSAKLAFGYCLILGIIGAILILKLGSLENRSSKENT